MRNISKTSYIILALCVFLNAFTSYANCDPKVRIKEIEKSAKYIVSGKCVLAENVYETTRFLKSNVIKYIDKEIDTVVIGSSNMLPYENKDKDKKFLNLAIGGANLQERLNMLGLLTAFGIKFKNVIFEIDAPTFRDDARDINTKYKMFDEYGNYLIRLINDENNIVKPNIDFNCFYKEDMKYVDIDKAYEENEIPKGCYYYNNEIVMKFPEYFNPPNKELLFQIGHVNNEAIAMVRQANAGADFVKGNQTINKEAKTIIDKLFNYFKTNNINVNLVIVPRVPYVYDNNNEKYLRLYKETEEYAYLLASKYSFNIEGSFDPYKYNLTEDDYFDGFHMFPLRLNKLFSY